MKYNLHMLATLYRVIYGDEAIRIYLLLWEISNNQLVIFRNKIYTINKDKLIYRKITSLAIFIYFVAYVCIFTEDL